MAGLGHKLDLGKREGKTTEPQRLGGGESCGRREGRAGVLPFEAAMLELLLLHLDGDVPGH